MKRVQVHNNEQVRDLCPTRLSHTSRRWQDTTVAKRVTQRRSSIEPPILSPRLNHIHVAALGGEFKQTFLINCDFYVTKQRAGGCTGAQPERLPRQ